MLAIKNHDSDNLDGEGEANGQHEILASLCILFLLKFRPQNNGSSVS